MCTPPFLQGGLSLQTKFQKGGLTGPQLLEGGLLRKRGITFFRGGCNCHIKSKLKSEIFNDKKSFIQYRGGDCLKKGAWTVCRFKEALARKRGWCFRGGGGGDTPMHIMLVHIC